jgi:phage gpG-like protein
LQRIAQGLDDREVQKLAKKVGEGIRSHWKRQKLTNAGPRYLNVLSDTLRSSVSVQPHARREAVVGTNVIYAPVHEYGTRDGRLRARHHLEHSVRDSKREQSGAINEFLRQLLGGR